MLPSYSWALHVGASLSVTASTLLPPATARAENASAGSEDIVVTAAMAEGVGIGTKLPLTIAETPQTISIIDRDRLDEQRLITLDDVMTNAPGITVQPGTRLRTAYYARGFIIDTLSFDGIPTSGWNEAVNTEDMAIYDRVELLRGASGLLQGTGNPSGTINLVRKRPGRALTAEATLSAGNWNNARGEMDVSVPLDASGELRTRIIGVAEDRDYYYDAGHRRKFLAYGTIEWNLAPRTVFAATIKWQDVRDDGTYMGVPLYADGGELPIPRSRYPGAPWSDRNWSNVQMFAELRHGFASEWEARIALSRIVGDSDLTYASAYGAVNRATGLGPTLLGGAYNFRNRETDLDGSLSGGFDLFGQHHQILIGANYWDGHTRQISYSLPDLMQAVNLFADEPVTVARPVSRNWAGEQTTRTKQYGGYAVIRLKLADPLTLIGGARLSWWQTRTVRRADIGGPLTPTGSYKIARELTPYGGIVWKLGGPFSFYASYASIFTPQNYLTHDGTVIDPMTGSNVEAGLKGEWFSGKLNASLALFRIRQENRAQLDPAHPCAPGSVCAYIAEGKVESKGVDAEIQGELTEGWSLQAGYTYVDTEYLRDRTATGVASGNEGQSFSSFTPHHMVKLWTHYKPAALDGRLGSGGGLNWQSSFYVISNGTRITQSSYAVVNLRADYALTPKVDLGVNANNLFDKRYFASLGGTAWNNWYGEPRSIMATLRVRY